VKRILFANRFYWPEKPATGQLLTDLATALARRGFDVSVITSGSQTAGRPLRESHDGVRITRVRTTSEMGRGILTKLVALIQFTVGGSVALARQARRGTVAVILTDPPLASYLFGAIARARGARVLYWVQDVYPEIAAAVGSTGWPLVFKPLRNSAWRDAERCVAISHDMAAMIRENGVRRPISVIENWAPAGVGLAAVDPARRAALRRARGWNDDFVVQYSGNLGRVHDLSAILAAAADLKTAARIRFALVGVGAQRDLMEARATELGLTNIEFLPPQPRELLADSLGAADLHLITLRRGCERYVYPSKFYGIVAVGRPILFIGPRDCEMARVITDRGIGLAFDASERPEIADAIRGLAENPARVAPLAAKSADYARETSVDVAIERWTELLRCIDAC